MPSNSSLIGDAPDSPASSSSRASLHHRPPVEESSPSISFTPVLAASTDTSRNIRTPVATNSPEKAAAAKRYPCPEPGCPAQVTTTNCTKHLREAHFPSCAARQHCGLPTCAKCWKDIKVFCPACPRGPGSTRALMLGSVLNRHLETHREGRRRRCTHPDCREDLTLYPRRDGWRSRHADAAHAEEWVADRRNCPWADDRGLRMRANGAGRKATQKTKDKRKEKEDRDGEMR